MFQILFGDLLRLNFMISQKQLKIIEIFQKIWNKQTKISYSSEVYSICIVFYKLEVFSHDLSKNQLKLLVHITAQSCF